MFWKLYFWFFLIVMVFFYSVAEGIRMMDIIDILISLTGLVGLFLYAYKKTFLSSAFWKAYLFFILIWDFILSIFIETMVLGTKLDPVVLIIACILSIPIYVALYLYGFRLFKEIES